VETETGKKLRVLRTDCGGEFTSIEFGIYCTGHGVERHLTAPYSPQQNGVVERRNQTVVGMARSMLKAKRMPAAFWGEAVSTAVFILNRAPTKSLDGTTPFETWHGRKPDVSFLRTFGCVGHVKKTKPNLTKLEDRSTPMVFLGYERGTKAYRFYDPQGRRVVVSRDVIFDEAACWSWEEHGDGEAVHLAWSDFVIEHVEYRDGVDADGDAAASSGGGSLVPGAAAASPGGGSPAPASPISETGEVEPAPHSPAGQASSATPAAPSPSPASPVRFVTPPPARLFGSARWTISSAIPARQGRPQITTSTLPLGEMVSQRTRQVQCGPLT